MKEWYHIPLVAIFISSIACFSQVHIELQQPKLERDVGLAAQCAVLTKRENVEPVTFLFSHGLWGSKKNADWYAPTERSGWHLFTCPFFSFDYPDVGKKKGQVKWDKVNIGQESDMKALQNAIIEIKKKHLTDAYKNSDYKGINEEIVLIGSSRGAITGLNLLGSYPNKNFYIKAFVAEAPTDNISSIIQKKLGDWYLDWDWLVSLSDAALNKFYYKQYDPNGINPLTVVEKINKKIPVLFVHSKRDEFSPIDGTRALYYRMKESGHDDIYLVELAYGKHGKYNLGKSSENYQAAVHAFYKRYDIPYDPELALKGEPILAKSQPSLLEVEKRMSRRPHLKYYQEL